VAALIALSCNDSAWTDAAGERHDASAGYAALGTVAGSCSACHTGGCPVGVATQDPALASRLDPATGATRVANYLRSLTMEVTMLARACGKADVHHLEPEDLVALTVEAAAMARVPLAGTSWIPGHA
jgi:glutamate synthase domain-containing protein 2